MAKKKLATISFENIIAPIGSSGEAALNEIHKRSMQKASMTPTQIDMKKFTKWKTNEEDVNNFGKNMNFLSSEQRVYRPML